jgi:NADPH-dependent ferric siderophore reductase
MDAMNTTVSRRSRRQQTKLWRVPVLRMARLTPHMTRVTVGGPELADFAYAGTDQNVMLYFYPDDVELPEPLTLEAARGMWSQVRPLTRTYTVSRYDREACEIDFDFVLHDDAGPASDWAKQAKPGDRLIFVGPSPAYQPDPTADWHLLAGDESALPAIAASLEALPAEAPAVVRLVCDGPEHEIALATDADADIAWLHRTGGPGDADLLADALAAADFPAGRPHAFVHGEAGETRAVRRHLLADRGLDPEQLSCSPYWRRGMTDEAWRAIKAAWNAEVARDVPDATRAVPGR